MTAPSSAESRVLTNAHREMQRHFAEAGRCAALNVNRTGGTYCCQLRPGHPGHHEDGARQW